MKAQLPRQRCLIIGCSRTKNESSQPIPALQRYDGPSYRVLRHYLAQNPDALSTLDVFVLSAKYGLVSGQMPLQTYDQLMTSERAKTLNPQVLAKLQKDLSLHNYKEIFLSMGKTYLQAIKGLDALVNDNTQIVVSNGASGQKLTELRNWLWGEVLPTKTQEGAALALPHTVPQTVILRGRAITLTTTETVQRLLAGIVQEPDSAPQVRNWYVDINGKKISPKWAAQYLFGVPVNQFSADEARRVLRKLGLNCYQQ